MKIIRFSYYHIALYVSIAILAIAFVTILLGDRNLNKMGVPVGIALSSTPTNTGEPQTGLSVPAGGAGSSTSTTSNFPDTSLAQYNERPNAAVPASSASVVTGPLASGCSLTFSFAPSADTVAPGGNVSYSILISNNGNTTCQNVSFSIYYSDNEAFVSASPKPSASDYYWSIGNLASRQEFTATVVTKQQSVDDPYQISNEACATADNSSDVCPQNLIFLSSGGTADGSAETASSAAAPEFSNEDGIWVWQSPMQMAPGYASQMISALEANHFNTVYITIDDYLAIASLPDGSEKTAETQTYMQTLSNIITMANAGGIAVDVEGGSKDWAEAANRWQGYDLINFVSQYNSAYPQAKINALQFDVEPYLLPQYQTDMASVLTDYVTFIDTSAALMKNVNAGFSVVIPDFYDSAQQWTPEITYDGRTEYTYNQLLDVLKQKPDSELVVMAYRNFFTGDDGTEDLATPEIQQASAGGYSTKVIIAQETGDVQPSYVTFNGMTRADLFGALSQIEQTFAKSSNFGGVAVDYLDPFLQLK